MPTFVACIDFQISILCQQTDSVLGGVFKTLHVKLVAHILTLQMVDDYHQYKLLYVSCSTEIKAKVIVYQCMGM